ncbi:hypothetical protein [Vulcanisaeta distributa]|uniref:hypothetical protein n=1 Tax=Vulcanisaeta distributa TaxID=164451 RepID=UPI0006CF3424|nr:hypothetical protein [Vulcanisaeta distributa]
MVLLEFWEELSVTGGVKALVALHEAGGGEADFTYLKRSIHLGGGAGWFRILVVFQKYGLVEVVERRVEETGRTRTYLVLTPRGGRRVASLLAEVERIITSSPT